MFLEENKAKRSTEVVGETNDYVSEDVCPNREQYIW